MRPRQEFFVFVYGSMFVSPTPNPLGNTILPKLYRNPCRVYVQDGEPRKYLREVLLMARMSSLCAYKVVRGESSVLSGW